MYYRKVMCSDRPPEKNGSYDTSLSRQFFSSVSGWGLPYRGKWEYPKDNTNPEWWLEEIELPNDEEIEKIANDSGAYRVEAGWFIEGYKAAIKGGK